jgi:imidazolonepropionase-like amidohydrolase
MANYVLLAKTILAGDRLSQLANGCIMVKGSKIEYVGDRSEVGKPGDGPYETIDLGSSILMPGMIDSHNHTSLDARLDGHLDMMNDSECALTIRAIKCMRDDLMSGVTSSRCLGEKHYVDVTLRNEINAGRLEGPRLQVAGIGMRSVHGHGYVGVPHTGEQEFRKTCRENMLRKVDLLKIFVTGGAPPLSGDFVPCFLSVEEIATVTSEAKRMGLRSAAHCIGGEGLTHCIKAGIDVIEHAYCAADTDLELRRMTDSSV